MNGQAEFAVGRRLAAGKQAAVLSTSVPYEPER